MMRGFAGGLVKNLSGTHNLGSLLLAFGVGGIGVWSDRPPSRLLVPHPSTLTPLKNYIFIDQSFSQHHHGSIDFNSYSFRSKSY